jgi:hypothetical protein
LPLIDIEQKEKKEPNDREENENLSDNIKQSMFQDYKLGYSDKSCTGKVSINAIVW